MECLGSMGAELAKCSCSVLGRHVDYLVSYKKKMAVLSEKIQNLLIMKNGVEQKVSEAERRGDRIVEEAKHWLNKVDSVVNDTQRLKVEASGINSCFKGWCCARYGLGKKITKMIHDVTELLQVATTLGDISIPVPIQDIQMTSTGDFEEFDSREFAMSEVKKALLDDGISLIGVHGAGGIGKTTLMRNIGSEVKKNNLFGVVVMVAVSQNQDMKRIQNEIAGELSLSFGQEGADSRRKRLVTRIMKEKSILIILDDIWSGLDLAVVGIPWGEDHKGCKIVLTTRRLDVCNMMATQKNIELEYLSEVNSWDLFRKNVGTEADSPDLVQVAKSVAGQCKGLPVALVTLGRAMRGKDKSTWEDVLAQLMESDFNHIEGMDANVFKAIKLSYDYLGNEDTKSIFLFCSLMDDLLRYIIGEGIIKDVDISRSKRKLNTAVRYLTSSHLLLKGATGGYILMHDIIRDVAIIIATDELGFIVRAGMGLEGWRWPTEELLRKCKRLSLMGNELGDLPKQPKCPNLLTLSLSRCKTLTSIPETFFEEMKSLVNLDLSYTPISSLPSSLTSLNNLRSLCLDGCSELRDASVIGKLDTLEVVSLENTSIEILPVNEIMRFPNRKLLRIDRNLTNMNH